MAEPTLFDEASLALIASGGAGKDGKVYSVKPVPEYGPELVTNGDFATDSDWNKTSAWSISGGAANCDGTQSVSTIIQNTTNSSGKYFIQFELKEYTQGIVGMSISGTGGQDITVSDGVLGIYNTIITTTSNNFLIEIKGNSNFIGSIDNVSVKKVLVADGDFTFSRGSNLAATRVGPTGLIEKGRENLWLQSTELGTSPNATTSAANITGGQSGYDGSTNAWELESLSDGFYRRLYQSATQTGVITFSIYAKSANTNSLLIYNNQNGDRAWFDLSTGSLGNLSGAIDSSIEAVGATGWYRCSMSINTTASSEFWICPANSNNVASCDLGNSILLQSAQLEIGLAATEVITTGATTVKAGLLEDEPRFDYSGGATCPSLLLEPSRTNLVEQSEYIDSWSKLGSLTISNNNDTSPEGIQNTSLILPNAGSGTFALLKSIIKSASSITYTLSGFAKAKDYDFLILRIDSGGANGVKGAFDLSDGTISTAFSTNGTGFTLVDADIKPYENNWYRYEVSFTTDSLTLLRTIFYVSNVTGNGFSVPSYTANGTDGILFWGAQMEEGTYPTSYIPNHSGGSVTRGADECNGAGDASTFNSAEGVLYAEIAALAEDSDSKRITISDGSLANRITISISDRVVSGFINVGNATQYTFYESNQNVLSTIKIAVKYKTNDFALWINGSEYDVSSSGSTFSANTLNELSFDNATGANNLYGNVKQVLVFKEALSDTELIKLTTI